MKYYALTQATKKLTMFYQRPGMSNGEYKRQFDALWDTVAQFGGPITKHPTLINARASELAVANNHVDSAGDFKPNDDDIMAASKEVDERMRACFMLGGGKQR